MKSHNILGIIPARFGSSRFPGKPLVDIDGSPMVVRVAKQALQSKLINKVIVATDDSRISDVCNLHGIDVVITSSKHPSGTDRCLEAYHKMQEKFDVVVNIQGDEPFIPPSHIDDLCECFEDNNCEIATLIHRSYDKNAGENSNRIKVVKDLNNYALYFSRGTIPFNRTLKPDSFLLHIGLYAYKVNVLEKIASLPPSQLEETEMLEQLRWLENGYRIKTKLVDKPAFAIDTPEDLEHLIKSLPHR
ncbi:MAG: 3-deoxy-manno-octulosonate cytidylyltransferase [Flavobacteriales bacterium]